MLVYFRRSLEIFHIGQKIEGKRLRCLGNMVKNDENRISGRYQNHRGGRQRIEKVRARRERGKT